MSPQPMLLDETPTQTGSSSPSRPCAPGARPVRRHPTGRRRRGLSNHRRWAALPVLERATGGLLDGLRAGFRRPGRGIRLPGGARSRERGPNARTS
jgi:hypothetical protein